MAWTWSPADLTALGRFLPGRGLLRSPDVAVDLVGDGHSNLTFVATDGTTRVVVRRPPVPPGAHDVLREAAFVGAPAVSGVPVPHLLATAEAGEVIDEPLAVTSPVAGPVVTAATRCPC